MDGQSKKRWATRRLNRMSLKDRIVSFKLDVKKFLWYLITEPFRIVLQGVFLIKKSISLVQKVRAWMYIFLALTLVFIVVHQIEAARFFIVLFVLTILFHEWERGFFRKRWKDKEHRRAEKYLKRNVEVKINGRDINVERPGDLRAGKSDEHNSDGAGSSGLGIVDKEGIEEVAGSEKEKASESEPASSDSSGSSS
jgi:hypothetical protein